MLINRESLDCLKIEIKKEFENVFLRRGEIEKSLKEDNSIVTEIDLFISNLFENKAKELGLNFFSEENQVRLEKPCLIIDPIDGTRELSKGVGECVVAVSIHANEGEWAWLYNPFTGFEVSSTDIHSNRLSKVIEDEQLLGLVSRSETKKGYFDDFTEQDIIVTPRGSIAFKLGLLATGACDFIYSASPKNIWDIDAGTIICKERGFKLYQDGKELDLDFSKRVKGNLLWCRPEHFERLNNSIMKYKRS